ncbi:rhomboid family intramembrane serine protease [Tenacibaculum maritimum]|uniref:rhomboid family intramembrane serine protease n=1 Tax=Tenacibaculum maritimum TaxID=107401 RepID=UPI003875ED9C
MMEKRTQFQYSDLVVRVPLLYVFIIWLVYWVEIRFGFNFNKLGIYPRTIAGFKGVFFTHFIHSDTKHLFNNSIPLLVLVGSLFYFYKKVAFKVLLYGGFLTGFLTWCIARDSYHIGASGIVYLLFSFIFFSGIIKKHYRLIALSLMVIFLYGSMIWYIFPVKEEVSWEGHLSGFFIGFLFAFLYRKKGIVRVPFQFSKTAFDDHFDEAGNYIPPLENQEEFEDSTEIKNELG